MLQEVSSFHEYISAACISIWKVEYMRNRDLTSTSIVMQTPDDYKDFSGNTCYVNEFVCVDSDYTQPISNAPWIPNSIVASRSNESPRCRTSSIDRSSFLPPPQYKSVTSSPPSCHQVTVDQYATLRRPCRSAVQRPTETNGISASYDRYDHVIQRRPANHRTMKFDDTEEERQSPLSSSAASTVSQVRSLMIPASARHGRNTLFTRINLYSPKEMVEHKKELI
jgi:hypothetical protein